jgi:hypothetical protein
VRPVQRLFACVLVLLVIGESSGVARAFGLSSDVTCCCGTHASARPCGCRACPAAPHRHRLAAEGDQLTATHDCDGGGHAAAPGVLAVRALPPTLVAVVDLPALVGLIARATPLCRAGRAVDVGRPPP